MIRPRSWLLSAWHLSSQAARFGVSEWSFRRAAGDTANQVMARLEGAAPATSRRCVFVHYEAQGRVLQHTRAYLEALAEADFSILFVSNAPRLEEEARAWLAPRCTAVLLRRNRGYDFGAYRDGIRTLREELPGLTMLLLANDSVYGPLTPLSAALRRFDFTVADVWALTDSWQHGFHLQSYFLAFGPAALASPIFHAEWEGVRNVTAKWAAVRHYELRMTRRLEAAGLRCAAAWDYISQVDSLLAESGLLLQDGAATVLVQSALREMLTLVETTSRNRAPLNPTSDLWLWLLLRGYPFIKRELLRLNPSGVPNLHVWRELSKQRSPSAYQAILDDLKRSLRRMAP